MSVLYASRKLFVVERRQEKQRTDTFLSVDGNYIWVVYQKIFSFEVTVFFLIDVAY